MRERVASTCRSRVKQYYCMDSWTFHQEVWGHQYDELAATHERSPPQK